MLTHDAKGRRFAIARDICHDPVEMRDGDFAALEAPNICAGPLFTCDVLGFMGLYRKREKYNRDRLRLMFNSDNIRYAGKRYGPVLDRPEEQLDKKKGSDERYPPEQGQMMAHNINGTGKRLLRNAGRYHRVRPGGWWNHSLGNARISAGLILGALGDEMTFRPQDYLVKKKLGVIVPYETPTGIEIDNQYYVPDNLFGFNRRHLILETDLGNETGRVGAQRDEENDEETLYRRRKSYDRLIRQLHALIGERRYSDLYRIDGGLLAAFATTSMQKYLLFKGIVGDLTDGKGFNWLLLKHVPWATIFDAMTKQQPLTELVWEQSWERVGNPPFYLNNPERQ